MRPPAAPHLRQLVLGAGVIALCFALCGAAAVTAQPPIGPATIPALTPTPSAEAATRDPELIPTRTALPSRTAIWLPSPTPPRTPSPICDDAPASRLIVGERARVLSDDPRPLNLRMRPEREAAATTVIAQIPIGALFYVLEGPVCAEQFAWFQVAYRDGDKTTIGWIAEGQNASYFVEPYPPGW